jgi:hypothetical protein
LEQRAVGLRFLDRGRLRGELRIEIGERRRLAIGCTLREIALALEQIGLIGAPRHRGLGEIGRRARLIAESLEQGADRAPQVTRAGLK